MNVFKEKWFMQNQNNIYQYTCYPFLLPFSYSVIIFYFPLPYLSSPNDPNFLAGPLWLTQKPA